MRKEIPSGEKLDSTS